jgi:hypothetical protein
MNHSELEQRAKQYAALCQTPVTLKRSLGVGNDGSVWESDRDTAIKALLHTKNYFIERDCYQRFSEYGIEQIQGFSIPPLRAFNDGLQVIEIGIVQPPFIIDFAKCYLDFPPRYPEGAEEERRQREREWFGRDYPTVLRLLRELESLCCIYYVDANPGNIKFGHLSKEADSR